MRLFVMHEAERCGTCRSSGGRYLFVEKRRLLLKHRADLGLEVPAVTAQSADGTQLAGLGPPCHRLRVDAERGGDRGGSEERVDGYGFPSAHCGTLLVQLAANLVSPPPARVPKRVPDVSLALQTADLSRSSYSRVIAATGTRRTRAIR